MATFDQRGQTVQYQYNAGTINFGQAKTLDGFRQELKKLQAELERAVEAKAITGGNAIDAETHVKKAILLAEEATPNKKTLMQHLASAKDLVTNVDGLVTAVAAAATTVGKLFL